MIINEHKHHEKEVFLPENFEEFVKIINILLAILILIIPIFGYLFKEDFIFFIPLVILIIVQFSRLKSHIDEGTTSKMLVNKMKMIGIQLAILWAIEIAVYFVSVYLA